MHPVLGNADFKLAQVAFVVRDLEGAIDRWCSLLGQNRPDVILTEPGNSVNLMYRGASSRATCKLAFLDLGGVQLELIEPIETDSAWAEGLDEKGERMHHLAYWVTDMKAAVDALAKQGILLIQRGDMGEGQYAYFDALATHACYLELLEARRTPLDERPALAGAGSIPASG